MRSSAQTIKTMIVIVVYPFDNKLTSASLCLNLNAVRHPTLTWKCRLNAVPATDFFFSFVQKEHGFGLPG